MHVLTVQMNLQDGYQVRRKEPYYTHYSDVLVGSVVTYAHQLKKTRPGLADSSPFLV